MEQQAQQYLQKLETAGRIMLDVQMQVSDEDRRAAEAVFMNFRCTENPYSLCRYLMDNSKDDYVLFETVVTLRNALIRDWDNLLQREKDELRQYLFQFIIRDDSIVSFVREKILQVIAIIIKRGSVEDNGRERSNVLDQVEKLFFEGDDLRKQILGCLIISALMLEYSTTIKSTDVGLTWESHYFAKKQFENTDLRRIFIFSTRALNEVKKIPQPLSQDVSIVLKHLLKISESVLVWGFISTNMPKYLVGMFEGIHNSENSPTLKLGSEWKEIITNPETVDLYFRIYLMVRETEFSHHCLNCLVQLSSISGNIWTETNEKINYMKNYLENFLKLVPPNTIVATESIGVSTIIKRIINGCTPSNFIQLPSDLVKHFLGNATLITCHFAQGASIEEHLGLDDKMFLEAFNNILRPWVSIIANSNQCFSEEICKSASFEIFNMYTKWHLSPPNGTKISSDANYDEHEEDDRIANKEQLQYIGIFGRLIPEHTLPLLVTLLEGRIKEFQTIIEHVHNTGNSQWSKSFQQNVNSIHEDLHWLFLIAGHVLTVDSEGEPGMIPSEIMHNSIKKSENVNIDISLKFLTNHMLVTDTPGAEEAVDDVIKIVSIVFHFCELEKKLVEAKMECLCSPLLSSTLVWFLREFSQSYLMPNESYYNELSMPLLKTFGQHTEAANWVLNVLLNKVEFNIRSLLYGDVSLAEDTIGLLVSLVEIRHKAEVVIKCEGFWKLFQLQEEGAMVSEVKEGLYKAFSLAADPLTGDDQQNEYWKRVITPTLDTFRSIVSNGNFRTVFNDENVRNDIIDVLHKCIGLASGAVINTTHTIFHILYPTLNDFSSLIGVYHNYQIIVHLIVQLFNEFAKKMLCFLRVEESDKFFTSCYKMVEMFARYNRTRVCLDSDAEEQSFQDLYLFLELLMQVMSKEVLDLSSDGRTNTGKTAGDVCVYGIKVILPLMTDSLLRIPTLCLQYYKCVVFMGEMVPSKLCFDDTDTYKGVIETIKCGLTMYGSEITILCTDFLQTVASYLYRQEHCEYLDAFCFLSPFLKYLMELILSSQISYDALSSTGNALFIIASCFPDLFRAFIRRLVIDEVNASKAQKLHNAINSLTANIEFNGSHLMKCRFKSNFDTFVTSIRGFLFVK